MKNRIQGVIAISSVMANWNADFTGSPKCTSDGEIFGSDKALKYSIRRYMNNTGHKVLFFKSYKADGKDEKLQPKDLNERYEEVFKSKIEKKTSSKEVLKNLFSAVDVMNFGATFAVADQNISLMGVVQIGQGFNKYEDSTSEVQDILSPFRNSKKGEADASTLGKQTISNEAHYFYSFSVNPQNYDEYIGIIDGFNGYTKEAYEVFKEGALVGATALNTCSKTGCENEFALFIEFKEGAKTYLPNLDKYIIFEKDNENIIDLTKLVILEDENILNSIEKIEVYYNPYTTELKHNLTKTKVYNIFTREEI
ncbi:CRISPR-associated protein [Clostridium botulinum]|uniref:type I CRISPR-associated protein Cas7 n=1 Tax=Clostridium botulinum TaxID=1491 RepID=UPI0007177D0B|nr:type I CRISPR-associated protein Cas7 [Clostridium botulinum]KRU23808.1 CRISPR-associated protein [Clostridium sporogenes]KRU26501.1 CRISPR-associated protein [Clostridium sporogenes]KRU28550.1 CRISPR-associated protein [Clostridium sporogenes]KRU44092.1 CRISPR-associated protein [Clostridium sporogenes]MBZ1331057.1 type I CRISPR-associated protein Cas7 [Clostridium botulinum]